MQDMKTFQYSLERNQHRFYFFSFSEQRRWVHSKEEERAQTLRKKAGDRDRIRTFRQRQDGSTPAKLRFISSNTSCPGLVPQSSSLMMSGENSPR